MFYSLTGTITLTEPYLAVIDCGGVGYACNTTSTTLSALARGERATLFTYLYVREEIFDLYGFATRNELNCFKLLLGISGVGPRAALSLLSASTPERLAMAIITEDTRALTAAQGIGKKIAQRIVLELKDKLAREQGTESGLPLSGGGAGPAKSRAAEAMAALGVLGYSAAESAEALRGIDAEALSLEEVIRQALKRMLKQ